MMSIVIFSNFVKDVKECEPFLVQTISIKHSIKATSVKNIDYFLISNEKIVN